VFRHRASTRPNPDAEVSVFVFSLKAIGNGFYNPAIASCAFPPSSSRGEIPASVLANFEAGGSGGVLVQSQTQKAFKLLNQDYGFTLLNDEEVGNTRSTFR
jgi:hypothetical protein